MSFLFDCFLVIVIFWLVIVCLIKCDKCVFVLCIDIVVMINYLVDWFSYVKLFDVFV